MSIIESAGKVLIENGLMGAVFIFVTTPLAIFAYRINNKSHKLEKEHADEIAELTQEFSQKVQDSSEKRTEDAKEFADKVIGVNDKWNEAVGELIRSAESQKEWIRDIKEIVKDLSKNAR